ncbi:MAG: hypothetical protein ACTHLD_15770 [Chitinophaga sp.]
MAEIPGINYVLHQQFLFAYIRRDERLHANHVSLYFALFQLWNVHRFQNPFPIRREEVLSLCRIGSVNTYTRCLKELDEFGYICYHPAGRKGLLSRVSIVPLELTVDLSDDGKSNLKIDTTCIENDPADSLKNETTCTGNTTTPCLKIDTTNAESSRKNDTSVVSKLRHLYKHINLKVNNEREAPAPIKKNINQSGNAEENEKTHRAEFPFTPPTLPEVGELFSLAKYPAPEAAKFFHHYQANGWLQAGKTPIIDWRAAAHKWMLNILNPQNQHHDYRKYQPGPTAGRLHTREDKDYADPL